MQDDKDAVIHKPAKGFEHYRYLPEYIEGIIVGPAASPPERPITLNQSSSARTIQDLLPWDQKTINGIAADITDYVNQLKDSDFIKSKDFFTHHRAVTADMAGRKPPSERFKPVPDSILEKIVGLKDYRESRFDETVILLHTFIDPENPGWSDAMQPTPDKVSQT